MNFSKLFNGNTMGVLMGMLTGGQPDMKKLVPIITDMVTDENVQGIVSELHKAYHKQLAKLQPGHYMKIVLEPDMMGRGLCLVFWDFAPDGTAVKMYDNIYLAEITADILKQIIQHLFNTDAQPAPLLISETTDQVPVDGPEMPQ